MREPILCSGSVKEDIMSKKSQAAAQTPAEEAIEELQTEIETLSKIGEAANLDTLVLGMSPAVAAMSLYTSNVQSLDILYENAVATQNQQTQLAQNALQAGIAQMRKVTSGETAAVAARTNPDKDIVELLETIKKLV